MRRLHGTAASRSGFAYGAVILGLLVAAGPAHAGSPLGVWINQKQTVAVRVAPCDSEWCGRIVWLARPYRKDGTLKRDGVRPWCGLTVLRGFRPRDSDGWMDGTIYDPGSGSTYLGRMKLTDSDLLEVRGYALLAPLGLTLPWRRLEEPPGACPTASDDDGRAEREPRAGA